MPHSRNRDPDSDREHDAIGIEALCLEYTLSTRMYYFAIEDYDGQFAIFMIERREKSSSS